MTRFTYLPTFIAAVSLAGAADAGLISNGDLETPVSEYGSTAGNSRYYLDTSDNNVYEWSNDTGVDANEWLSSVLPLAFDWSATGGNGGTGGFIQDDSSRLDNEKPRAVAFFAEDDKATTGTVDISIDVNLAQQDQFMYVELYAWDTGETSPRFSLGGGNENDTTFNHTILNDADTLLEATADTANLNEWETVSLGSVNLGSGHDHYAWRVSIVGSDGETEYAFDNLTVIPEPSSLALIGLGGMTLLRRRRKN